MMKKALLACALGSIVGSAAYAQVAANVSLTTNYKYRGQDQSDNQPAIQGGFDYANGGFYVGNWNSSIGFTDAGIEMDLYGGYKGKIWPGFGFDVGLLHYAYPSLGSANTTELYGAIAYSIATLKYSHTVSNKYFGVVDGRNTGYWDLSANYPIASGFTLNAHVGATQFSSGAKDNGAVNYTDYKLGATYDLGSGFTLGGHVAGANKRGTYGDINKSRLILSLAKSI